jgi:hypothetical protein
VKFSQGKSMARKLPKIPDPTRTRHGARSNVGNLAATEAADKARTRAGVNVLEVCRQLWESQRNSKALLRAITHCHAVQQPPPTWLVQALASALPIHPSPIDVEDWVRWSLVRHAKAHGRKWPAAYDYAADHCGEHISPATARSSYLKVQKAYREGKGWEYPDVVIRQDRGHLLRSIDTNGVKIPARTSVMVEWRYDDHTLDLRAVVNGDEILFRAHERDVELSANGLE